MVQVNYHKVNHEVMIYDSKVIAANFLQHKNYRQ